MTAMQRDEGYSVLMSVYRKEQPAYLRQAMDSMWAQTAPPAEFVLMCDGPLTPELDAAIARMQEDHPAELRVIRFEENQGLGKALNRGVQACRCPLIARMDSDDVSRPQRCEKELALLDAHPEIDIVGGAIEEFTEWPEGASEPARIDAVRRTAETPEAIREFAKTRNPFNHPSVMYRKAAVLDAGNYEDVRYLQDYYLWIRMLLAGKQGMNLAEPLVWMRADANLFKRRSGKLYRQIQLNLFRIMRTEGFITRGQYLKSCALRAGASVAPNWLRSAVFHKVLRK